MCPRLSSITTRIKTPPSVNASKNCVLCPRLSSITTRIKTSSSYMLRLSRWRPRLSSITTRIKTELTCTCDTLQPSPRLSSITTRIKTPPTLIGWGHFKVVRDYLPLQQGLRHRFLILFNSGLEIVRDYLPLQQGLRRLLSLMVASNDILSETIFHYNKD